MVSVSDEANRIVKAAHAKGRTLATVESCTAGMLVARLAQAEGASETVHGGFVVYTKRNKTVSVGVPEDLIRRHTAVSREVVEAMARGGLERSPADIVLAVTGVAGPEPDEDGNPVGLAYVAAASRDGHLLIKELHLTGSKSEICEQIIAAALRQASTLIA
jgi:nicotinamide-nucleotide amidase